MRRVVAGLVAGLVVGMGLGTTALRAQWVTPPVLSLSAGQMRYTMSSTRTGTLVALRLASPIVPLGRRNWLLEPGAAYVWYRADDGSRRHLFVPEVQVQLQVGPPGIQPYVGVGGGLATTRVDTVRTTKLTASAAAGLRLLLGGWGIAGELRVRSLSLFQGTTRELTVSLFRKLE